MQKTKFQIKGMHCQSCATLIEEKLKNQAGIMTAKVNFETGKAVVFYDERKIQAPQLQKLVQEVGDYKIEEIENELREKPAEILSGKVRQSDAKGISYFQNPAKNAFLVGLLGGLFLTSLLFNFFFIFSSGNSLVAGLKATDTGQNPTQNLPPSTAPTQRTVVTFDITKDNHVRGDFGAPITLVEFSDFECPFCEKHYPTLKKILNDYQGKVRLVYKHFPLGFHPNAQKAAEASECADEQGKFWAYHDKLFDNQPTGYSLEKFKQWAKDLGLNTQKFNNCLDADKYAQKVQADYQEGAQKGVNGTPATFVNGRLVSGAVPYEAFKSVIDQVLNQ